MGKTGPYHRTCTRALFPSLSHLDVTCRLTCKIYFRHGKFLCRSSQEIVFVVVSSVLHAFHWWLSGMLADKQTRQPPTHSEKYQCRIDTVSSPDDGHTVARNMYRS